MTLVVDASVAIKWFVSEDHRPQARYLLRDIKQMTAPDLIVTEVANIAWKKTIRREIDCPQATFITTAVQHYIPVLQSWRNLIDQALDIAIDLNHPIYDCLYLACAEATDSVLVTADRRLVREVADTAYSARVRFVADIELPPASP